MTGVVIASAPPAAGAGVPAVLLHYGGVMELDRSQARLRAAGCEALWVVTGCQAASVREAGYGRGWKYVHNPAWASDSVASLELGWAQADGEALVLVDGRWEARLGAAAAAGLRGSRAAAAAARGSSGFGSSEFALAALRSLTRVSDDWDARHPGQSDEARLAGIVPPRWRELWQARLRQAPCHDDSPRCEYWKWGRDSVRPACCTRHLRRLLEFTAGLLERQRIPYWLDYGPLLGAVREQQLIAWDYDVDFGVMLSDRGRIAELAGEVAAAGHLLDMRDDHMWRIQLSRHNTLHADLFPWHPEDGRLQLSGPFAVAGAFPPEWLQRLQPVRLMGREYPAPAPVEEFLERYRYGPTWRTPQRFAEAMSATEVVAEKFVARQWARQRFRANLRRLHDTMAATECADRYWLWGGQLLGMMREQDILAHDDYDADFAVRRGDLGAFYAAVPPLLSAGFEARSRYRDNAGREAEFTLCKDGARFDFFVAEERNGQVETLCFGRGRQLVNRVPEGGLCRRTWLERDWLTPANAEAVLTAMYGDWRTPQPQWDYTRDDGSIAASSIWRQPGPDVWTGQPA